MHFRSPNFTELVPLALPNCLPEMVTRAPRLPEVGAILLTLGAAPLGFCCCHVAPPSVVAMILPLGPTAQPRETSTKDTPVKDWKPEKFSRRQVWPASDVATIPWSPTAHP